MKTHYSRFLFLGSFFIQLVNCSAPVSASNDSSESYTPFDRYAFSNRETLTRIGMGDGSTPLFAQLSTLQQKLSSAFPSGMESSMSNTVAELSARVGAFRTSVETDLTALRAQMSNASQSIATAGEQIKTSLLEKIVDDCFPNSLIANQTPAAVFVGDSSFSLSDGDGKYVLKGGATPYSLFASNNTTQQAASLLLKPEDKTLTLLSVLFGLSQDWVTANTTVADDLGAIVSTVFDYVLGTGRDGTGTFKDGSTVTNVFSKHSSSVGTTTIAGKTILATGGSVSAFMTGLGVTPEADDVKRFRVLCRYLLTPKL